MDNFKSHIKFTFEPNKAIQAVLWLLHRNNKAMDKLQLVKLFFYADREHLVRYGRPIAGGDYYAMSNGPVCSQLLDMLNTVQADDSGLPLKVRGEYDIIATEPPDTNFLSESDLNVLDEVYKEYGHIDKWKLRDMTHLLPSYQKNEPSEEEKRRFLPYEDFFEDYDSNSRRMLQVILDEQEAWADFI